MITQPRPSIDYRLAVSSIYDELKTQRQTAFTTVASVVGDSATSSFATSQESITTSGVGRPRRECRGEGYI